MKNLIVLLGLILSMNAFSQEASWKTKLRSFLGPEWATKILGEPPAPPVPVDVLPLPEIPINFKDTTAAHSRKEKAPTDYDKFPANKKRQLDYNFLRELFRVTRKTEPKEEDLSNWMNTLDQGGSREGIYQALVLDEVYATMEAMEQRPAQKLVDFYIAISAKFFKQGVKAESLETLNLYTLKRVLTEKGLDLMEYYEIKDLEDLYKWYANFSADLGKGYGQYLTIDGRKTGDPLYHYEWAKKMPVQHLKSEFIIKLHSVMNGLQEAQ